MSDLDKLHAGPIGDDEWQAQELKNAKQAALHFRERAEKAEAQVVSARKALEPFAQTGWLPYAAERDGLTVIAYVHADSRRELDLSSADFFRAAAVFKEMALTDDDKKV